MASIAPAPPRAQSTPPLVSRPPIQRSLDRRRAIAWTMGSILLALLLRAPFLTLPLRVDEGGLALIGHAFIAAHGHADGSIYGGLWLDRPPLLVLLYGTADWLGGALGVRLIGTLAAAAVVGLSCRIAVRIGYRDAVPFVGIIAALLTSAPLLSGPYAYPELLASATTALVVLLCCTTLVEGRGTAMRWFTIGALAVGALLLKQSFLDALAVSGVSALIIGHRHGWARTLVPYGGGIAAAVAATGIWAVTIGPGARALTWAMFGFRIAGMHALQHEPIPMSERFHRLLLVSLDAGLPILLPAAIIGIALLLRARGRAVALLCATWIGAGLFGVLGGGYYWGHYMLQLVPSLAVLGGIVVARIPHRWIRVAVTATFATLIVATSLPTVTRNHSYLRQRNVTEPARMVASNRRPGDRALVLYSRANATYYTKVKPAFAYQWSLMYVAIPGVERQLNELLGSPKRPTWIIRWQPASRFGLDRSETTATLVDAAYRRVATICGHDVLLRREDTRPLQPVPNLDAAACRS